MVFHQGAPSSQCFYQGALLLRWSFISGLLSRWSFIKQSFIGVVFHQSGHLSGWSFTGVVFHQWSFIRVVFHWGGLSSGWYIIMVVFHQCGLKLGWSFITVVFYWSGLYFRLVFHQGGLLSGRSFIGVVSKQGGLLSGVLCALDRRNAFPVSTTEAYIHGAAQLGEDGGVVVDDGAAGAGQTLHLVDHQVTALVLLVVGHHKALWNSSSLGHLTHSQCSTLNFPTTRPSEPAVLWTCYTLNAQHLTFPPQTAVHWGALHTHSARCLTFPPQLLGNSSSMGSITHS